MEVDEQSALCIVEHRMETADTGQGPSEATNGSAPSAGPPQAGRRTRWVPALLTLTVFVVYYVATRPGPPLEGWGGDIPSAIAQAASTDKKVLIAFHTDDCPPCVVMERTVLNTARVQKALDGYIPVMVDPFRQYTQARGLGVFATPTYVVLDSSGRLLARAEGLQSAERFLKLLDNQGR